MLQNTNYNFEGLEPEPTLTDPRRFGIPEGVGEPISTITGKPLSKEFGKPEEKGLYNLEGLESDTPTWGEVLKKAPASGLASVNVGLARLARDTIKIADMPASAVRKAFGIKGERPDVKFLEDYMIGEQKRQEVLDVSEKLSQLLHWHPKRIIGTGLQAVPQVAAVAGGALMGAPFIGGAESAATMLGAIAYGPSAEEAKSEGANEIQQILHGITSAQIEVLTELPVFRAVGQIWKHLKRAGIAKKAGVSFAKRLLTGLGLYGKGLALETTQEVEAYLGGQVSKKLHYDPNATINFKDAVEAGYGGLSMAATVGIAGVPGMAVKLAGKGRVKPILEPTAEKPDIINMIDEGMTTGEINGEPFTPEIATGIIQEAYADKALTSEDLDAFREKYPNLRPVVNDVIGENVKNQINTEMEATEKIKIEAEEAYRKTSEYRQKLIEAKMPTPTEPTAEVAREPVGVEKKVVGAEKIEKVEVKEPWEMTKKEFSKATKLAIRDISTNKIYPAQKGELIHVDMIDRMVAKGISQEDTDAGFILPDGSWLSRWTGEKTRIGLPPKFPDKASHKFVVEKALKENKSVPAEVLAEYPDLKPLPPKPPKAKPPEAVTEEIKGEVIPEVKPKTLKKLAEAFIDGKITGNQDQIVANWVSSRKEGLSENELDKKIDSAIRNFEQTKQGVLRERARLPVKPKVEKEKVEVTPEKKLEVETTPEGKEISKLKKPTGVEAPEGKVFATKTTKIQDPRQDFQEMVIAGQKIIDEIKEAGLRKSINADGTITIYHGTSEKNADKIMKEGRFEKESFFSPLKGRSAFGSEGAKWYGRRGKVLSVKVDARDINFVGTGEIEVSAELVRDVNGIWRSPERIEARQGMKYSVKQATKPQDTITRADLKSIFSKMKNISTGVDKDGNFFFRPLGKPVVTILEVNEVKGYIDTSKGQIPVGSFLGNTIELKTGGEGHTADIGTVWHEYEHWMEANGILSNNDVKALDTALEKQGITPNTETRATYVGDRLSEWQSQKNLRIKRVLKKIADFVNSIWEFVTRTRTARGILKGIETGKILGEEIVGPKAIGALEADKVFATKPTKDYKAMLKENFVADYIKVLDRYEAKLKAAETKLERIKTSKEILKRRRGFIKAAGDYFNLTDKELRQVSGKDIRFMSNFEFKQYIDGIRLKAEKLEVRRQAMNELMTQIRDKELNIENLRKAMKLPTLKNMTVKQIQLLDETLAPFQKGDEFLTVRKLEVVDRTELKGIKTWREARGHLAEKISKQEGRTVSVAELQRIKVSEFDRFRYDTGLAEKDPFYRMMVEEPAKKMLVSETEYLKIEQDVFALAKKIKGKGFFVPQLKNIRKFMESPADQKVGIKLTEEELALANYMTEYFSGAMDYLVQIEAMRMGKENYFTHVRRGILEAIKADGIVSAVKEQFRSYKLDEQAFNILDKDTGQVLAMDKFFKFAMHRTGQLKPTENVVKAFLTYVRTFKKKQALDEIVPLIDIYAHALTPKGMTKKGLLLHGNLIKFVKEWVNTQKGRHITLIAKQNGKIDAALRAIKMFTSLRDLGLNIPVSVATEVGEQITTYQLLGKRKFALGKIRQSSRQGKAIVEKYRNLIGKNPWKELAEPSKAIGDRLMEGIFVLFRDASVRSNKTFLLGSLSKTEFRAGEITAERLAALRTELGRYRMVEGMKSIIGATPEGKAYTQYKKWAIPILRTTIQNLGNLGKKITFQKPDSKAFKKSALELYRLVEITALVTLMFGIVRDEDDNSFVGKMINKAYREATTLIQALQPSMFLAAGRTASFVEKLGVSLTLIMQGEQYKTTDEYKGIKKLKRQFTPIAVSQFLGGEAEGREIGRFKKNLKEINAADRIYKELFKKDRSKALKYNKKTKGIKRFKASFRRISSRLGRLKKRKTIIMESKTYSANRKRKLVEKINEQMTRIAKIQNDKLK